MTDIAENLLNTFWDGSLPVNVVSIANSLGIQVVPQSNMTESGMIELINGKPVITYNSNEVEVRRRFTIAHELGHFVLGHLSDNVKKFRDPAQNFSTLAINPEEREANNFAASILMPAKIVVYAINQKNIRNIDALSNLFHVSQVAMKYRLINLRLINV